MLNFSFKIEEPKKSVSDVLAEEGIPTFADWWDSAKTEFRMPYLLFLAKKGKLDDFLALAKDRPEILEREHIFTPFKEEWQAEVSSTAQIPVLDRYSAKFKAKVAFARTMAYLFKFEVLPLVEADLELQTILSNAEKRIKDRYSEVLEESAEVIKGRL